MENQVDARFPSFHSNVETCGSILTSTSLLVVHIYSFVLCFIICEVVSVKMAI